MVAVLNFGVKLVELEKRKKVGGPVEYSGMGSVAFRGVEIFDFEYVYDKRNGVHLMGIPTAVLSPEALVEAQQSIRESIKDKYRGVL